MLFAVVLLFITIVVCATFFSWIVKGIVFFGFWGLSYWFLSTNYHWANDVAITIGTGTTISWAIVLPGLICLLALCYTREQ